MTAVRPTEQFALPRERSNSFEKFRPSDVRPSEPWLDDIKDSKHRIRDDADEDNDQKKYDKDEHYEDEDDEPVDPSVREDMKRLEDTFTGISKRFRLINRIGEGT
jgi:cell division control protein 7